MLRASLTVAIPLVHWLLAKEPDVDLLLLGHLKSAAPAGVISLAERVR